MKKRIKEIIAEIKKLKEKSQSNYKKQSILSTELEKTKIDNMLKTKLLQSITWQFNTNDVLCTDFSIIPAIYKGEKKWDLVDSLCDNIYDISHFTFEIKKGVEVYLDYDDSHLVISFKTFKNGTDFIKENKLKVDFSHIKNKIKDQEKTLEKFKILYKKVK